MELLYNDIMHTEMFYVVAGVRANYVHLHQVMIHNLYLLVNKSLSPHSLGQTTQPFGLMLLSHIKDIARNHSGPILLKYLINKSL